MSERRPVIALVSDTIAPYHRGGKEHRTAELIRRLAERGEVHVYTMNWWHGPKTRREGDITYHAISPYLEVYRRQRRSIFQALVFALCCLKLLFARFDLLEADHMPYLQLFPLRAVATIRRRRLVVTWHECWSQDYWRSYLGLRGLLGWMVESMALRLPDRIIAASPQTGAALREIVGNRVEVVDVPTGIDLETASAAEPADEPCDVIAVGRLMPHKRIDLLLEALAILRDQGRPLTARVVGVGPQLQILQAHARALSLESLVEFRQDIVGQHRLFGVLKAARVAVFPSEREGFGVAVLEALACGIPVITTSAPANNAQHLAAAGEGGYVCEPNAHALAAAIASVLEQETEVEPDTAWLTSYDWDSITERVAEALAA